MLILYKAEKNQSLKHCVQGLKGLITLLTPLHSPQHLGDEEWWWRKCINLWEVSVRQAQQSYSSRQQTEDFHDPEGRPAAFWVTSKGGTRKYWRIYPQPFLKQAEKVLSSSWVLFFVDVFYHPQRGYSSYHYPSLGTFLLAILHTMEFLVSCQVTDFLENIPILYTTRSSEIKEDLVQL